MWPGWPGFPGNFPNGAGAPGSPSQAAAAAGADAPGGQQKFANPGPLMQNLLAASLAGGGPFVPSMNPSVGKADCPPPVTMNLAADLQGLVSETAFQNQAAVRLRGLPFDASEQDILTLFSQHGIVDRVEETPQAVQLLRKPNGRPSGQAVVQLRNREDAELAQRSLHGQWMGNRYVEVFACDGGCDGRRLENGVMEALSGVPPLPVRGPGPSSGGGGLGGRGSSGGGRGSGGTGSSAGSSRGGGFPRPHQASSVRMDTV